MNTKGLIVRVSITACVCLLVYLVVDYLNLFTFLGFNPERINLDLMGIIMNAILAITLYFITFEFVDKRNALRQRNKEQVAVMMLINVYETCLYCISVLDQIKNDEQGVYFDNSNTPIDSDKYEELINAFVKDPFSNEHIVLEFFKDGTLSQEEYKTYSDNKRNYLDYMFENHGYCPKKNNEREMKEKVELEIGNSMNRLKERK